MLISIFICWLLLLFVDIWYYYFILFVMFVIIYWYLFRFVDICSSSFICFILVGICWYMLLFVYSYCYLFRPCFFCMFVGIECLCLLLRVTVDASLQKVYPKVYQKYIQKYTKSVGGAPTMHSFRFVFVTMCSYFLLFVCSRCLLLLLGSAIPVWYLLLLVGIRKYSKTCVHFVLFSVGICWYMLIFVVICCYLFVFVDICSYGICWYF